LAGVDVPKTNLRRIVFVFLIKLKKFAPGRGQLQHYRGNMNNQPSPSETFVALQRLTDPAVQGSMQSDADLLTLFVESGNRSAIETLVLRYAGMVASVCRATVSDPASAEDAFQATFLVLLKSAKKIQKRRSLAAWLHGVAYRTACRVRKQRLVLVTEQSPNEVIALNQTDEDPIDSLARKLELEALDQELEKLPSGLREILVEHYLLGYTAPQIANRTSLSVAAVEGRIRRGRYTLLRQLAKRGISLTVLVAASTWFQQHLQATEANDWANEFLDSFLPQQASAPEPESANHQSKTLDLNTLTPNADISSLVNGEMNMFNTTLVKSLASSGAVLLVGALLSFNLFGDGQRPSAGVTKSAEAGFALENLPDETTTVVAQIGSAVPVQGNAAGAPVADQSAAPAAINQPAPSQVAHNPLAAAAGTGDATGDGKPVDSKPIEWQTPEGEPPTWLREGTAELEQADLELREQVRAKLRGRIEVNFDKTPLRDALKEVSEMTGLTILIDLAELGEIGCDLDAPLTVQGSMSVREFLRRAFQTSAADAGLAYSVHESSIEITSLEAADRDAPIRYYDLSYVLPNDSHLRSVIIAIQQSIDPDSWLEVGGTNTISQVGSMLIIACPEPAHQKIEVMLARIAALNKNNLEKHSAPPQPPATRSPGGMGGMGMGGGMF